MSRIDEYGNTSQDPVQYSIIYDKDGNPQQYYLPNGVMPGDATCSPFHFKDHVVNGKSKKLTGAIIHIAFSEYRNEEACRRFPQLPHGMASSMKFCGGSATFQKYTENPTLATCNACLAKARAWQFGSKTWLKKQDCVVNSLDGLRLSGLTMDKLVHWMPQDCEISLSNEGIKIKDLLMKTDEIVPNLGEAALYIAKTFMDEFTKEDVLLDKSILKEEIRSYDGSFYEIGGLKLNKQNQEVDGLMLKKSGKITEFKFADLFCRGFHFKDGKPFGKYLEDRTPARIVEEKKTETEEAVDIF